MKLVAVSERGADAQEGAAPELRAAAAHLGSCVAKPLRELVAALDDARGAAPGAPRLAALDRVAVRTVAAVAPFVEEPEAMLPVQRALLLMPGKPDAQVGLEGLSRALRHVDERLGPELGGFSRLLENALSAGEVPDVVRLRASHIDGDLGPLAHKLEAIARRLSALDDLSHALSTPADLAAGAIVLDAVCSLLPPVDVEESGLDADSLVADWLAHRGLDARLGALFALRRARESLRDDDVETASSQGLARPLALWLLAHRLAARQRLETAPDRPALDELLERARLLPVEVFDVASLLPELMGD